MRNERKACEFFSRTRCCFERIGAFVVAIAILAGSSFSEASVTEHRLLNVTNSPLYFIENKGQIDSSVCFYSIGANSVTYLSQDSIALKIHKTNKNHNLGIENISFTKEFKYQPQINPEFIRLIPIHGNVDVKLESMVKLQGKVNYFVRKSKAINIPTYDQVKYRDIFDGVDMILYGRNGQLEYDFVVSPGHDVKSIQLSFEGIHGLRVDEKGDLVIQLKEGILVQHKPYVYQEIDGRIFHVDGKFRLIDGAEHKYVFGFEVGKYDRSVPLTIDPIINYSTYFGGSSQEQDVAAIQLDSSGNIYLTGTTISTDFPTLNPLQSTYAGAGDIFVTKLSTNGTGILWSTYIGGSGVDHARGLAIDGNGDVWISGVTLSTDFPTQNAYQAANAGWYDSFLLRLSSDGSNLEYSTYLGGASYDQTLGSPRIDSNGFVYLAGITSSADFPTTPGAYDTTCGTDGMCNPGGGAVYGDVFVTKFNLDGSDLIYSTYIGGSGTDGAYDFVADSGGVVFIHGITHSRNFPLLNEFQSTHGGGNYDTFVLSLDSSGASLLFSSYLGGSEDDIPSQILLGTTGIYLVGRTGSTDFPLVNPLQGTYQGRADGYVSKVALDGSALLYSTFLGGNDTERLRQIRLDADENIWVGGNTYSTDYPSQAPIQLEHRGETDIVISKISADGSTLLFSTYIGGTRHDELFSFDSDSHGALYASGLTGSKDYPTANEIQNNDGGPDVFIMRLADSYTEDFSDGNADGWTFGNGTWSVVAESGGGFALTGLVLSKGEALAPEFLLGEGSMEADIKIDSAGMKASLLAWLNKKNVVELQLSERTDKIILKQKSNGDLRKEVLSQTIDVNTLYHVRISFDGQNFEVFLDNNPIPIITMPALAFPQGRIGLRLKSSIGVPAVGTITNIIAN